MAAAQEKRDRLAGMALMTGSAASNQLGAATAALAFPILGPVLALALIFAAMNLSLYLAIDWIGLGLAVTLEFLGPLPVALLASRRVTDLGCALVAGAGAAVVARPRRPACRLCCTSRPTCGCWSAIR